MTKVLILEDSEERVKVFKKILSIRYELYFYDNVEKAIEAAKEIKDIVTYLLDHDLDHRVYVDSNEKNTGWQFAKWLSENNIKGQFITHTLNPVGAKNICDTLPGCVHVPFPELVNMILAGIKNE